MSSRWPILLLAVAACDSASSPSASRTRSAIAVPPPPATIVLPGGVQAPASFADLAEGLAPGVVFVKSQQAHRRGGRRVLGQGLGTGFAIDKSGLILTNHHVVANATRIEVVIEGREPRVAEVVGVDPPTDIALLRVEASELTVVPLGDSDSLRVGDWVLAIGNPFGLSNTVSAGIVSAKDRTSGDVPGLDPMGYYSFLQTDASINPGNSGGPLIDLSGHVVGINTAINVQAHNIGFAIPVNMVRALLPHLLGRGHLDRSALGVSVASLGPEDLPRLVLEESRGVLVTQVEARGPGDRAGLRVDDVILEFGGKRVEGPEQLRWLASIAGVGSSVVIRLRRRLELLEISAELGALSDFAGKTGNGR